MILSPRIPALIPLELMAARVMIASLADQLVIFLQVALAPIRSPAAMVTTFFTAAAEAIASRVAMGTTI